MVSSLRLEVLLEDVVGGTLLAPVSDDTRGAFDHLSSGALPVDLAQTSPLSELHVAVNLDERNAVLHAQGGDQLLVHGLVAVLGQDAQQRLSLVKRLGSLTDTAGESVGDESLLQDLEFSLTIHQSDQLLSDPKKHFICEVYFCQKKYIFHPERSTNCAKSSFSVKIIYELPHF